MVDYDLRKPQYNRYEDYPYLSYNCVEYLMENNEIIWRLLYYNDAYAFREDADHPNLTLAQKGNLIYDGIRQQTDCRVFLDLGANDTLTDQTTILRITPIELNPVNYIIGEVTMGFRIYSHFNTNSLANYATRTSVIAQQIIGCLNGQDVKGLGRMHFDSGRAYKNKLVTASIGEIPFLGVGFTMCNYIANAE